MFSRRREDGGWDYRDPPPEFWDQYNTALRPGSHFRIHPLLHWTDIDIWEYIAQENIPIVSLYFSKNGKRYRSLGENGTTAPIDSDASTIPEIMNELKKTRTAERCGRLMDHESEDAFERLRLSGYL